MAGTYTAMKSGQWFSLKLRWTLLGAVSSRAVANGILEEDETNVFRELNLPGEGQVATGESENDLSHRRFLLQALP